MVLYNVSFDEGDAVNPAVNPIRAAGATVRNRVQCCKWVAADMIKHQLQFYMLRGMSIKKFYKANLLDSGIPEKAFGTCWNASGLKALQKLDTPFETAERLIEHHMTSVKTNSRKRTVTAINACRLLTKTEEKAIVHTCLNYGAIGRGTDRDELLQMVNAVINVGLDDREKEKATEKVVRGMLERHPDLTKLADTASLDPLRAKKANKKTRDTVFCKLQAMTRALFAEGKIPWRNCCDIPAWCVYNMDEVGADTTKNRRKVIADKRNMVQRIFMTTPEGDRMKGHATACVTARADGACAKLLSVSLLRSVVVCVITTLCSSVSREMRHC
jgi:hypothetical protein